MEFKTSKKEYHLHVELKPFDRSGVVTDENEPAKAYSRERKTVVARRIRGCMNFACFLPADNDDVPAITQDLLDEAARRNQGKRELLSVRDAYAEAPSGIPVYRTIFTNDNQTLLESEELQATENERGRIIGMQLGCYAVLEAYPSADAPSWYKIQFSANATGWVSRTGTANGLVVDWVHVEDAPRTEAKAPVNPYFVTTIDTALDVYSLNLSYSPNTGAVARQQVLCGSGEVGCERGTALVADPIRPRW